MVKRLKINKMQVEFNNDHSKEYPCKLFLALSGNKEYIRKVLVKMLENIDSSYGKPIQGQSWTADGVEHVITPVWDNKQF